MGNELAKGDIEAVCDLPPSGERALLPSLLKPNEARASHAGSSLEFIKADALLGPQMNESQPK